MSSLHLTANRIVSLEIIYEIIEKSKITTITLKITDSARYLSRQVLLEYL